MAMGQVKLSSNKLSDRPKMLSKVAMKFLKKIIQQNFLLITNCQTRVVQQWLRLQA